jgi:hypothetical protein
VVSVVSSGLYAPWPFVNSRRDEMLLDGAVQWQHGGRSLSGTMLTAVTGAGDGFSVVHVVRSTANGSTGGWQIDVRLDLADGVLRCGRVLGDNRDRRWQVR